MRRLRVSATPPENRPHVIIFDDEEPVHRPPVSSQRKILLPPTSGTLRPVMRSFKLKIAFSLVCTIFFCSSAVADTLYQRLGGEKAVAQFVDQTVELSAADPLTKRTFDKVDLKKLKQKVAEQICALTNGPCKYSGDSMKLVHQGMDITEAEFYGFVEILRGTLNRAEVAEGAKNELLRILAPMKREIVSVNPK